MNFFFALAFLLLACLAVYGARLEPSEYSYPWNIALYIQSVVCVIITICFALGVM